MLDKELIKKLTKLDKHLTSKNIQSTLDSINDLYNDDYLLADDGLYDLFNFHFNILSISEAKSSISDDSVDFSNDKETIKSDNNDIKWLNHLYDYTDADFVHFPNVRRPIVTKEVYKILSILINKARDDQKFNKKMNLFYKKCDEKGF